MNEYLSINIMGTPSPLDNQELIFIFVSEKNNIYQSAFEGEIYRVYGVDYLGHALENGAEIIFGAVFFTCRESAEKTAAWLKEELRKQGFGVCPEFEKFYVTIPAPALDVPIPSLGYAVWYRKPEYRYTPPRFHDLLKTHVFVRELPSSEISSLDQVFVQMQGEIWSPNGEARELIHAIGLDHTSLSEGDIVVDPEGSFWVENGRGWVRMTE